MPHSKQVTTLSRRTFLAVSGAGASALAASRLAANAWKSGSPAETAQAAEPPVSDAPPAKARPIGIELYAVRGELAKDLPNTLRTVAQMGYEVVEFYAPYLAWTIPYAKDVRTQLDDLGVRCYSTHNSTASITPGDTMAKAIEINQILGARHIILASAPGDTQGLEGWKRMTDKLAAASEQLKPHGLLAGYHNHRVEWLPLDSGQRVMDVIAANTPSDFVLQLDVGTCVEAGADPVAWIRANPGRIRSVHLKDWTPGTAEEGKAFRILFGEGVAPWRQILGAVESVGGVEFYLMEQEGSRFSEFETARRCLATWRTMQRSR